MANRAQAREELEYSVPGLGVAPQVGANLITAGDGSRFLYHRARTVVGRRIVDLVPIIRHHLFHNLDQRIVATYNEDLFFQTSHCQRNIAQLRQHQQHRYLYLPRVPRDFEFNAPPGRSTGHDSLASFPPFFPFFPFFPARSSLKHLSLQFPTLPTYKPFKPVKPIGIESFARLLQALCRY